MPVTGLVEGGAVKYARFEQVVVDSVMRGNDAG
jgi:hypothetical protein